MEILWEMPYLEWVSMFIREKGFPERKTANQISYFLDSILQKMMIFDLGRKNSMVLRTKGFLVDDEQVNVQLAEVVLEFFCENPSLSASSAPDILKNLVYCLLSLVFFPQNIIFLIKPGWLDEVR